MRYNKFLALILSCAMIFSAPVNALSFEGTASVEGVIEEMGEMGEDVGYMKDTDENAENMRDVENPQPEEPEEPAEEITEVVGLVGIYGETGEPAGYCSTDLKGNVSYYDGYGQLLKVIDKQGNILFSLSEADEIGSLAVEADEEVIEFVEEGELIEDIERDIEEGEIGEGDIEEGNYGKDEGDYGEDVEEGNEEGGEDVEDPQPEDPNAPKEGDTKEVIEEKREGNSIITYSYTYQFQNGEWVLVCTEVIGRLQMGEEKPEDPKEPEEPEKKACSITFEKVILNNEGQEATQEDFQKIGLDIADTFNFKITLTNKETGEVYNLILNNKDNAIISDLPYGDYILAEIDDNYFNIYDFRTFNDNGEEIQKGFYSELGYELTVEDESLNIKVFNILEDERNYEDKDEEKNLFDCVAPKEDIAKMPDLPFIGSSDSLVAPGEDIPKLPDLPFIG